MGKHLGRAAAAIVVAVTGVLMAAPVALALPGGISISPNDKGLPGLGELQTVVGSLLTVALIVAVAAVAISGIAWAIGNHSANPVVATRGKSGVMVALAAAVLVGGAVAIVDFFWNIGAGIGG